MSIWQTHSWQDMLITSGQTEEYFVIERDIKNIEANNYGPIYVEKRKVSLGEYGLFIIGFEGDLDGDTQESLRELCREENCLFLQVETIDYSAASSLLSGENGERCGGDSKGVSTLNNLYYKKFIPPYTCLLDLSKNEEDILKEMKPKGRYNIKLARKKGVEVRREEKTKENIQKFFDLMQATTSRDKFAGNTLQYYEIFCEALTESEIFFAYHDDEVIAAGIFVKSGSVMTYYYGASSNHKRNLMAPYLLQWEAISIAKKEGYKMYDFLGVASPGEKNSSLAGVTDFKMKLCPERKEISKSYLYTHKKWKYKAIQILKQIKK